MGQISQSEPVGSLCTASTLGALEVSLPPPPPPRACMCLRGAGGECRRPQPRTTHRSGVSPCSPPLHPTSPNHQAATDLQSHSFYRENTRTQRGLGGEKAKKREHKERKTYLSCPLLLWGDVGLRGIQGASLCGIWRPSFRVSLPTRDGEEFQT